MNNIVCFVLSREEVHGGEAGNEENDDGSQPHTFGDGVLGFDDARDPSQGGVLAEFDEFTLDQVSLWKSLPLDGVVVGPWVSRRRL